MLQIDPVTVKQLDSNLFLGNEINEVYREIMKTVPSDHLDLENVCIRFPYVYNNFSLNLFLKVFEL
jgi:hypothetical protein